MKKLYLIVSIFLLTWHTQSVFANPFAAGGAKLQEAESNLVEWAKYILIIWFIIGVITWLIKRAGIFMLVILPLCGWALIVARKSIFEWASGALGGA